MVGMLESMGEVLTALKTAGDTFKAIGEGTKALKGDGLPHELNTQLLRATEAALDARREQEELITRNRQLEEEVRQLREWDAEKVNYDLVKLDPGILMYRSKPGINSGEPEHNLCATCFNNGDKSFLHVDYHTRVLTGWKCNKCGFEAKSGRGYSVSADNASPHDPLRKF